MIKLDVEELCIPINNVNPIDETVVKRGIMDIICGSGMSPVSEPQIVQDPWRTRGNDPRKYVLCRYVNHPNVMVNEPIKPYIMIDENMCRHHE